MKKRIKVIIIFIIGMIITGVISAYAATVINSSEVSYTSNGQTTVLGALDDLYTLSNTWIDPSYVDFTTLDTNAKQTILASKNGVCIKRNNKVSCFKTNNWNVEKDHIQEVFSDVGAYNSSTRLGCYVSSTGISCYASDFGCFVGTNGYANCTDKSDNSECTVNSSGTVDCSKPVGIKMNSAKTVIASKAGLLFKRSNGNVYFLGINNYSYEKDHVQQVFSDVGTYNSSTGIGCDFFDNNFACFASDVSCAVHSNGYVNCRDYSNNSYCSVDPDGTIYCN